MSRFYLTINGGKSNSETVTRRANGGAVAHVASWNGAIRVTPYAKGDLDYVKVERVGWQGSGGPTVTLFDGPFDLKTQWSSDLVSPLHGAALEPWDDKLHT